MFCIHDSLLITFSRCKNSPVLHPLDILRIAAYIKFYRRNRSVLLIKNKTSLLRSRIQVLAFTFFATAALSSLKPDTRTVDSMIPRNRVRGYRLIFYFRRHYAPTKIKYGLPRLGKERTVRRTVCHPAGGMRIPRHQHFNIDETAERPAHVSGRRSKEIPYFGSE